MTYLFLIFILLSISIWDSSLVKKICLSAFWLLDFCVLHLLPDSSKQLSFPSDHLRSLVLFPSQAYRCFVIRDSSQTEKKQNKTPWVLQFWRFISHVKVSFPIREAFLQLMKFGCWRTPPPSPTMCGQRHNNGQKWGSAAAAWVQCQLSTERRSSAFTRTETHLSQTISCLRGKFSRQCFLLASSKIKGFY